MADTACCSVSEKNPVILHLKRKIFEAIISLIWPICDITFHDTIIPVNFTTCQGRHVAIRMHSECVQLVQLKGNNRAYRHGRLPFKLARFPLQIFLPLNICCHPSPA